MWLQLFGHGKPCLFQLWTQAAPAFPQESWLHNILTCTCLLNQQKHIFQISILTMYTVKTTASVVPWLYSRTLIKSRRGFVPRKESHFVIFSACILLPILCRVRIICPWQVQLWYEIIYIYIIHNCDFDGWNLKFYLFIKTLINVPMRPLFSTDLVFLSKWFLLGN